MQGPAGGPVRKLELRIPRRPAHTAEQARLPGCTAVHGCAGHICHQFWWLVIIGVLHNLFEAISGLLRYTTTVRRIKDPWVNSTLSLITLRRPRNNGAQKHRTQKLTHIHAEGSVLWRCEDLQRSCMEGGTAVARTGARAGVFEG